MECAVMKIIECLLLGLYRQRLGRHLVQKIHTLDADVDWVSSKANMTVSFIDQYWWSIFHVLDMMIWSNIWNYQHPHDTLIQLLFHCVDNRRMGWKCDPLLSTITADIVGQVVHELQWLVWIPMKQVVIYLLWFGYGFCAPRFHIAGRLVPSVATLNAGRTFKDSSGR
jgi:hypothetical protein